MEMGFIVMVKVPKLGERIQTKNAAEHIFG